MEAGEGWLAFATTGGPPWRLSRTFGGWSPTPSPERVVPPGGGVSRSGRWETDISAFSLFTWQRSVAKEGRAYGNRRAPGRKISAFGNELPQKMLGYPWL